MQPSRKNIPIQNLVRSIKHFNHLTIDELSTPKFQNISMETRPKYIKARMLVQMNYLFKFFCKICLSTPSYYPLRPSTSIVVGHHFRLWLVVEFYFIFHNLFKLHPIPFIFNRGATMETCLPTHHAYSNDILFGKINQCN